ncbi:uncharacterized protein LOC135384901 [Ornithodoros turicata]|uniref:uncharacterized protein LOC135384901 n=1 Tax=Ornithodoros turicata TaxID=34597 RepID=UPI0031389FBD
MQTGLPSGRLLSVVEACRISVMRVSDTDWMRVSGVAEIQSITSPDQWRHCPGRDNPADLLTRGTSCLHIVDSPCWWNEPEWLCDKTAWPPAWHTPTEVSPGVHHEARPVHVCLGHTTVKSPPFEVLNYSSFSRLLRVTAWVQRFLHNSRYQQTNKTGALTTTEVEAARRYWIVVAQQQSFGHQPTEHKSLQNTSVFRDEHGILRMKGRLQYGGYADSLKHPIIIPTDHPVTALLVMSTHTRLLHTGVQETLAELREEYWVIRGRQVVKRVLHQCLVCKRAKARVCTEPMAPLLCDRVSPSPPFEVIGTDYAGPLYYKSSTGGACKSYILIFTCAVTRAIHLELTRSMSAEDFMQAFKRFIARRGVPLKIYSDNFLTFKRVRRDLTLARLSQDSQVTGLLTSNRVTWRFIEERAAWWGGFWERLIRSVKTSLRKVLGKSTLRFEDLATVVTQVEAVINSRPLTYISEDPSDSEALSPAHFLVGKRLTALPAPRPLDAGNSTSGDLRRRWAYQENLTAVLWAKWTREYILCLRSANICPPCSSTGVKVGHIVLLAKENVSRVAWPLGRVEEVFVSADGRVRSCRVRLADGRMLTRPIQLLYRLEGDTA